MVVKMTVEIAGLTEVARGFDRVSERATDLSPLMDNIGALLEQSARDRIEDSNTGPDGVAWPKSLRAQEGGGKTLFDSGQLAASLTHQAGRRDVVVGSNKIYAGIHQAGATITPKNGDALAFRLPNGAFVTVGSVTIPARPYLGVSAEDEIEIGALATDYFTDLSEAGA